MRDAKGTTTNKHTRISRFMKKKTFILNKQMLNFFLYKHVLPAMISFNKSKDILIFYINF